jgi:hypothetical protein
MGERRIGRRWRFFFLEGGGVSGVEVDVVVAFAQLTLVASSAVPQEV